MQVLGKKDWTWFFREKLTMQFGMNLLYILVADASVRAVQPGKNLREERDGEPICFSARNKGRSSYLLVSCLAKNCRKL